MPSAAYDQAVAEATRHHARSKTFSGKFLRPHKPFLLSLIAEKGIASALDYGVGKGAQYTWIDPDDGQTLEQAFGFEVAKYDPCYPPYAAEPVGTFDLVLCTHTLGSIPVADQAWVIDRLYSFATKAVYIAEKLGPIRKEVFSDPGAFPRDWTRNDWLAPLTAAAKAAKARGVTTIVSFRTRDETDGVQVERLIYSGAPRSAAGVPTGWRILPAPKA